jgi:hypothetical protein
MKYLNLFVLTTSSKLLKVDR